MIKFPKSVKRLDSILVNQKPKEVDYEYPTVKKTPYIVDDSCFQPISEALKTLKNQLPTTQERQLYYDFPDGKDDGSPIPINRRTDISDITEMSNAIVDEAKRLALEKEKLTGKLLRQKQFEQAVSANNQPQSTPPNPEGK